MLPVVLVGPLLLVWLPMARTRRFRLLVAAFLVVVTAVAALLVAFFPRGLFEITLAALVVTVATVVVASVTEQRRLRRRLPPRRIEWLRSLFAVVLLMGLGLYAVLLNPAPFLPSADTVLPLPGGLHATVEPEDGLSCGSGSCTRIITVAGRPGQSGADLQAEVERHVRSRGWDRRCRPAGWLLDRTTQCIDISQAEGHLVIRLLGARDDLQHLAARGAQSMVWPPLTVRRSPVMKRAASLATKATTSAMSSGLPSRPSGTSRT